MKRVGIGYCMLQTILCLLLHTAAQAQVITTIAGTGVSGFSIDGTPATLAQLNRPEGIYVDSQGNVYFSEEFNHRVRKINTSGIITTIAGTGAAVPYSGSTGPATSTPFVSISGVHKGSNGEVYLCDITPSVNRVLKVDTFGMLTYIAGNGMGIYSGDGGPATAAGLKIPNDVESDRYGNLYIADAGNYRIRKVDTNSTISTVAGSSTTAGFAGDGGQATAAILNNPRDIAVDRKGNIYIADASNYRIRKVNTSGIINTICGGSTYGYAGDGGIATLATLSSTLVHIAVDELDNIFIADGNNNAIRKINALGIINTIAGNGTSGYSGDGGPATAALLNTPFFIALHPNGDVYFIEKPNHVVRKISYGNHIPISTNGHMQPLIVCQGATASLNVPLAVSDVDAGQTLTWVLFTPPAHGTATVAYTSTATGGTILPTGLSYTPTAGYAGLDTYEVRVDDGRSVAYVTFYVTVNPLPVASPITGKDTVCVGSTTLLSGPATGTWSSGSTAIATVTSSGLVTGVSPGTAVITYTVTNTCSTAIATRTVNVFSISDCPVGIAYTGIVSKTISISPNPTTGTFTLNVPYNDANVLITDPLGKKVKEFTAHGNADVVMNVPAGIYFVTVTTADGKWATKLVVEK